MASSADNCSEDQYDRDDGDGDRNTVAVELDLEDSRLTTALLD